MVSPSGGRDSKSTGTNAADEDSPEKGTMDQEEAQKSARRSNQRRHTHNSREKLNVKFKELSRFVAPNVSQSGSSSSTKTHKSKIISDAIQMYNNLVKKREALETELVFSSLEKLEEWLTKIVEKKREDLYEILEDIVRVFCVKQEWILGEVWAPEMTDEKVVLKRVKCVKNPCCDRDETLFIEEFIDHGNVHQYEPPTGPQGRAFQTLRPEWLSDLNDPTIFPAGETARESGITTACSLPVKSEICNPPILAVVMFYSREAMPFDSAKLSLAGEIQSQSALLRSRSFMIPLC
uniref:BHLH domain-containing protein n=1 Tax=Rhodosorus marinus TaxID=101924 RepID=A0A7S3EJQ1_9RHOD|mmetsp:Transcript_41665/g.163603  ORF Transcript_41665/g.163603 Transcript_41665/m.163603 type:complete len:293 (+) Transcript_41665:210-1088(+)